MTYLKQKDGQQPKKRKRAGPQVQPVMPDFQCITDAIEGLASIVSTYVTQERNGDNAQPLYSDPSGYPVKIAIENEDPTLTLFLEGDAVNSIADSLKRIADALASKTTRE